MTGLLIQRFAGAAADRRRGQRHGRRRRRGDRARVRLPHRARTRRVWLHLHEGRACAAPTWAPRICCRASSASARATELLFLGDTIGARERRALGLFNARGADRGVDCRRRGALAARLARGPAFAHAMTKQMFEHELDAISHRRSRRRRRPRRCACRHATSVSSTRPSRRNVRRSSIDLAVNADAAVFRIRAARPRGAARSVRARSHRALRDGGRNGRSDSRLAAPSWRARRRPMSFRCSSATASRVPRCAHCALRAR